MGVFTLSTDNKAEPESGIYIACADGTFRQRILPFEITTEGYTVPSQSRLAALPDGSGIVFSYLDIVKDIWLISVIDLSDYRLTELIADEAMLRAAHPSPDGEYIAYARSQDITSSLEVLHIESRTFSSIVSIEDTLINNVDWSPDGKRILLDAVGPLGQTQTWKAYAVDIVCDPTTHVCLGNSLTLLQNVLREPSWASDSSLVISASEYAQDVPRVIRITEFDGTIVREIKLVDIDPGLQNVKIKQPILSPDGARIAFLHDHVDIYVLDIESMSLLSLTSDDGEVIYSTLEWLP